MINIFYSKLCFDNAPLLGARKEVCSLRVNKRRVLMLNVQEKDKCTFWMHFSSSRVFRETSPDSLIVVLNVCSTAQTSEIASFFFSVFASFYYVISWYEFLFPFGRFVTWHRFDHLQGVLWSLNVCGRLGEVWGKMREDLWKCLRRRCVLNRAR
jgi:hypothetical protein